MVFQFSLDAKDLNETGLVHFKACDHPVLLNFSFLLLFDSIGQFVDSRTIIRAIQKNVKSDNLYSVPLINFKVW